MMKILLIALSTLMTSTTTFLTSVIKAGTIELNTILMESNAQLTIETSAKLIDYGYAEGFRKDNLAAKRISYCS